MRNSKGQFMPGHKFSKAIRIKMGLSRTGPLNHMWGKVTSEKTKEKMRNKLTGLTFSEARKQKLRDYQRLHGNPFKCFLKRLTPISRELYLKSFGEKVSTAQKSNIEYIEKLRLRMMGNTFRLDYLKRNPVYTPPDWINTETGFSVPAFIPLIPSRIKPIEATRYYTQGIIPQGLPSSVLGL